MFVPRMSFREAFRENVYKSSSNRGLDHHIIDGIEVENSIPSFSPPFAFSSPWWNIFHFSAVTTSLKGFGVVSFMFVENFLIARIIRHQFLPDRAVLAGFWRKRPSRRGAATPLPRPTQVPASRTRQFPDGREKVMILVMMSIKI